MPHKGCKHLDYEESNYPTCKLVTIEPQGWQYWERPLYYEGQRIKVQFCKLRGRINEVFACINPGEMDCFEPAHQQDREQKGEIQCLQMKDTSN